MKDKQKLHLLGNQVLQITLRQPQKTLVILCFSFMALFSISDAYFFKLTPRYVKQRYKELSFNK